MLIQKKYRLLFSPKRVRRRGPKGPAKELIDAVVEMKRRNPTSGCKRIARQIALAFGVEIDKDVVRRILSTHFHPEAGPGGPSWLSVIGHAKDSLWSLDLFRCESAILRTYWVLVMMDQFLLEVYPNLNNLVVRGLIAPRVAPLPATALTVCCRSAK